MIFSQLWRLTPQTQPLPRRYPNKIQQYLNEAVVAICHHFQIRAFVTVALGFVNEEPVVNALNAINATLDRNTMWMRSYGTTIGTWLDSAMP